MHVAGVIKPERSWIVRAQTPGFLAEVHVREGETVVPGDELCQLENDDILLAQVMAARQARGAEVRLMASYANIEETPTASQQWVFSDVRWKKVDRQQERLAVIASAAGTVLRAPADETLGKYYRTGEPMVEIGTGDWLVKTLLTAEQLADFDHGTGDRVSLTVDRHGNRMWGTVVHIASFGDAPIGLPELTHLAGGEIIVDPETMRAEQPYFEVTIALDQWPDSLQVSGQRVDIDFVTTSRPLASVIHRRWLQFLARYRTR